MAKALKTAGAICAMGVMILLLFFDFARDGRQTAVATQQAAEPAQKTVQASAPDGQSLLFEDLNMGAITAISVHTPDRSFQFHADGYSDVSVNGQQADSEIYMTLVNQICELPVKPHSAFSPDSSQLLLTIVVSTAGGEHVASFYEDNATGEFARIIAGPADAPQYRQTSGWRVGTLMMTCEGTRIQDERGNETPSSF